MVLFAGCVSERTPGFESSVEEEDLRPVSFSLNEKVVSDNIAFRVKAWGFYNRWKDFYPADGAKFVWIDFESENVGDVPAKLPKDFHLEYRGINTTAIYKYESMCYHLRGTEAEEDYFPGDGREGFILFEVSEDLGEGEAEFYVEYSGKSYVLDLEGQTAITGPKLTISDEGIVCSRPNPALSRDGLCRISFSLTNNMPIPFMSKGITVQKYPARNSIDVDYSIDNKFSNEEKLQVEKVYEDYSGGPVAILIEPGEESDLLWGTAEMARISKYTGRYYHSLEYQSLESSLAHNYMGDAGDSISVSLTLYGMDSQILAEKNDVRITLPEPDWLEKE